MHIDGICNDGVSERLFQLRGALHLLRDLARINRDLAAATSLGAIERRLGAFQQILEFIAGEGIDGETEGGGKPDVAVAEIIRGRKHVLDHVADTLGASTLEHQRQHEGEFVTVMARHDRAIGNAGLQPVRDLAEDFIARLHAEKIVDGFEAVYIGNADREGGGIAGALAGKHPDLVPQTVAVAQPRQRVAVGHRLQLVLADLQRLRLCPFHSCIS
ncbi:hypothetical protein D3C86_1624310 [compost metagenome]